MGDREVFPEGILQAEASQKVAPRSGKALQWVLPLPSVWEPAFQGVREAGLARDPPPREDEGKPLSPGPKVEGRAPGDCMRLCYL